MKEKGYIVLNSAILYILAFLTTTIIHEFFHAMMGVLNDSNPVLHHNYVEHLSVSHLSITQKVLIALAGPIASLVQGIGAGILFLKASKRGLMQLFYLWLSVLGLNNFLGYLMTGPLFQAGDIGKSYQLLELPLLLQIIIAIVAAATLLFIAYKLTIPFLEFSYQQMWLDSSKSRKAFSFQIIILPWLIGSAITTILYLPIVAIVSIIYPFFSGMVFIYPWQNAEGADQVQPTNDGSLGKLSIPFAALLVTAIAIFRLLLAPGIEF